MNSKTLERGAVVYLSDGREAEFVTTTDLGVVVRVMNETSDGDPVPGKIIEVREVFDAPPRTRLDKTIADLREEIATKRDEIARIYGEIRLIDQGAKTRLEKLKQHEALKHLEDFLAGNIKHVVKVGYLGPEILTFDEAFKINDRYANGELKLLTLFGSKKNGLNWGINHYSDGSGGNDRCFPCCSREEVDSIVTKCFETEWERVRNNGRISSHWINAAKKLQIEIPLDIANRNREECIDYARSSLKLAQDKEFEARGKLEDAIRQ